MKITYRIDNGPEITLDISHLKFTKSFQLKTVGLEERETGPAKQINEARDHHFLEISGFVENN